MPLMLGCGEAEHCREGKEEQSCSLLGSQGVRERGERLREGTWEGTWDSDLFSPARSHLLKLLPPQCYQYLGTALSIQALEGTLMSKCKRVLRSGGLSSSLFPVAGVEQVSLLLAVGQEC